MKSLINFFNNLSDNESIWGPFLFLRPEPTRPIGIQRLFKIALAYGAVTGAVIGILNCGRAVTTEGSDVMLAMGILLLAPLFCFAFFFAAWWILALAWNARARSLQNASVKTERAPESAPVSAGSSLSTGK